MKPPTVNDAYWQWYFMELRDANNASTSRQCKHLLPLLPLPPVFSNNQGTVMLCQLRSVGIYLSLYRNPHRHFLGNKLP